MAVARTKAPSSLARWVIAGFLLPFGDAEEAFTVRFDPRTGLLRRMESLRYQGEGDEHKTPWVNEVLEWRTVGGHPVPTVTTVAWGDDRPRATLRIEDVVYNADLAAYIAGRGP